jgi:magnesium transporter
MMNDERTTAEHGDIIILEILYEIAVLYIKFLNQINDDTERLETSMKRKVNNDEIFQLMDYQRSLTAINTSLKGLKRLLTHIKENDKFFKSPDLMEDTVVAIEQASEMADIFNSDLDALMDAFGSVLSNNVNQIMKILTALTLIIAIPTMVAGIYGMNVKLPFAQQSWAFTLIVGISVVTSLVTGIIFYRKNML